MMPQLQKSAQSNLQQYLRGAELNPHTRNQSPETQLPHREPIKHLLIGSPKAVTSTIHHLQIVGYANVGDWSPLLPTPNSGEVMSILSRQILL